MAGGCFITAVGASRLRKSWREKKNKNKDKLQPSGLRPSNCRTIIGLSSRLGSIERGEPIERKVWILLLVASFFCLSLSTAVAGIKG